MIEGDIIIYAIGIVIYWFILWYSCRYKRSLIYVEMSDGKIKRCRSAKKALQAILSGQAKAAHAHAWISVGPKEDGSSYLFAGFESCNEAKHKALHGYADTYSFEYLQQVIKEAQEVPE